jgi:hypothetical protein
MQKTSINPEILQPMFESAANAAQKGQSQFVTPIAFGRKLAAVLPRHRPCIVDLNCGPGHLLQASVNSTTLRLLGCDIDPCRGKAAEGDLPIQRLTHDATRLYPWFKEVGFAADLLVLNPPWKLAFYRERLADLAESALPSVRMAFAGIETRMPKGTIDSTIAMYLMALDLCTSCGEGLLIANNKTLERLLFAPGAPHGAAAKHVWARVVVKGNPMTGIQGCQWQEGEQFETGVIYFARDHTTGPRTVQWPDLPDRSYRPGAEVRNEFYVSMTTHELWQAVRDRLASEEGKPKTPWNLWIENGVIQTALSLYEKHSKKINKKEVERLFKLQGRAPMELVLQRASRDELLRVAQEAGWRVHPDLLEAVRAAVHEYHAERAPLYPLPEIQRLGYLDEEDTIECRHDLSDEDGRVIFRQGSRYPLRTQTVNITRKVERPNAFTGEKEELEFNGQELSFFIGDEPVGSSDEYNEFAFMDAKLINDPNTTIPNAKTARTGGPRGKAVDFTLQQLCTHFVIPEVPDVATVNPKRYESLLLALSELESLTS